MKKIIASLVLMGSAISMNAAVNVSRIEPTDWYVGMKDAAQSSGGMPSDRQDGC